MKAIDIEGELRELVASEEVLAYFDFTLPLGGAADAAREVEGLCKVSRPRERKSRSTYLSLFFIVDAPDDATRRAIDTKLSRADWNECSASTPGVDCVMAIPHRHAGAGLFLKEIDAYLDGVTVRETARSGAHGLKPEEVAVAAFLRARLPRVGERAA